MSGALVPTSTQHDTFLFLITFLAFCVLVFVPMWNFFPLYLYQTGAICGVLFLPTVASRNTFCRVRNSSLLFMLSKSQRYHKNPKAQHCGRYFFVCKFPVQQKLFDKIHPPYQQLLNEDYPSHHAEKHADCRKPVSAPSVILVTHD